MSMIKILSLTQHLKDNKYEAFSSQSVGTESFISHVGKTKKACLHDGHWRKRKKKKKGRNESLSFKLVQRQANQKVLILSSVIPQGFSKKEFEKLHSQRFFSYLYGEPLPSIEDSALT